MQARTRETQESLEYQTAISEVLEVISRSPSDIQPVLDTIAETAQRLCQSEHAYIMRLDRGRYYPAAAKDARAEQIQYLREHPVAVDRGSVCGRVALERRTIHVTDALADSDYTLSMAGDPGYRTILGVPLLRDGVAIGVIVLTRAIVRPFSDEQIGLVSTFADQALIAIENVRLFEAERERTRELSASLDQQTAASEVLQLISSSPGELGPVFQTMLENAVRICGAKFGTLFLREADAFRVVATHNAPPAHVEALTRDPLIRPPPDVPLELVRRHQTGRLRRRHQGDAVLPRSPSIRLRRRRARRLSKRARRSDAQGQRAGRHRSTSFARRWVLSTTSRSSWFRILPSRRSSRSRTRGCSTNCASPCSSRLRLPMCSR